MPLASLFFVILSEGEGSLNGAGLNELHIRGMSFCIQRSFDSACGLAQDDTGGECGQDDRKREEKLKTEYRRPFVKNLSNG